MNYKIFGLIACLGLVFSCSKLKNEDKKEVKKEFKNFITAQGHFLMDGANKYRFISMNIPNLNYIEDELSFTAKNPYKYPTEFEIRDAFETVKQMGGKVVRMYTIPVKRADEPDNPTFVTGPGEFVEEAYVVNDLMLKIANETGIRVIFSLSNNHKWMGGAPQYAQFRGKTFEDFWVDPQLINDFKKTVEFTLNRTNTLTGVKYKDDKSIMCWETGNELESPYSWVKEIAAYIKSLDTNHLVMDGYFATDSYRYVHKESVEDPNIDILSSHHYEQDPYSQIHNIETNLKIIKAKKPYILGELGFESVEAHRRVYDYIIKNKEIAGTLNWSIRSHREGGGFYWHSEPIGHNLYKAYHWPGFVSGREYDEIALLNLVREKAYEIDSLVPPVLPAPKRPKLLPIDKQYAISWQGSVGALGYHVERAIQPKEGEDKVWKKIAYNVSDAAVQYVPLFNDKTAQIGESYYYRIEAVNNFGVSPKSNAVGPVVIKDKALIDEMGNFQTLFSYKNVKVDRGFDRKFKEDTERILGEKGGEISYHVTGNIKEVTVYVFEKGKNKTLEFSVSNNGKEFIPIDVVATGERKGEGDYGYWNAILYKTTTIPNNSFLKITFKDVAQIGRVQITYQ